MELFPFDIKESFIWKEIFDQSISRLCKQMWKSSRLFKLHQGGTEREKEAKLRKSRGGGDYKQLSAHRWTISAQP